MKIKLFGKNLFEFNKNSGDILFESADSNKKKIKILPDFYQRDNGGLVNSWRVSDTIEMRQTLKKLTSGKNKKEKIKLTPKEVHELKALNDKSYKVCVDKKYVDAQIKEFKDKLILLSGQDYDMRNGVDEINSILIRLENRKEYPKFEDFFDQFPYTLTTKISDVLEEHDNLKIGRVGQFMADMPKEATKVMKDYSAQCKKLCGKDTRFYIIAEKKDFEKSNNRKDPILLAQSPFAHAWQILGAWDKEMLLLEDL